MFTMSKRLYVEDPTHVRDTADTDDEEPPEPSPEINYIEQPISLDLTVIDTPGLNETMERDLSHMVDLIETISYVGEIYPYLHLWL